MARVLLGFITAFAVTVVLLPPVIYLSKKLKVRQTVLHYVDNHLSKSGTPTMGGVAVILGLGAAAAACRVGGGSSALLVLLTAAGYGVIGFLDDFIKIYYKQNMGLSAWQKILFQTLIAVIVSVYAYNNPLISDVVYAPFSLKELPLGLFAPVLYTGVFLAFTNSVNLTDGLDGLASKTTAAYCVAFAGLLGVIIYRFGADGGFSGEYLNLIIVCAALVGALCAFLCFNAFPAKIFMGDTGALALGGALAALAVVSRLSLFAPILGVMYVLTSLSVILQVLHFKRTRRRLFLMAPLHHHFERKDVHENRISTLYAAVTLFVGSLCVAITLALA
ncbi:MAG: phospho-N-acetylmuramoyl-pentapeptide-transferase [Clostridiales bacterium]|jgi:phospho-N-acetylmuramoyl-pentapeptide-transferase|nr:phospho-N-acetylmuramoyl-pentapeptide-transferase [Clostridiales bacterium]